MYKSKFEHRKDPNWQNGIGCPICGDSNGRCSMTGDGKFSVCYRTSLGAVKKKSGELGDYWVHLVNPDATKARTSKNDFATTADVSRERLSPPPLGLYHQVYSSYLRRTSLIKEHMDCLRNERQIPLDEIERMNYKTSVNSGAVLSGLVSEFGFDLKRVPGFFGDGEQIKFCSAGHLVIPTINVHGSIINLRLRRNNFEIKTNPNLKRYYYASSGKFNGPKATPSYHFVSKTVSGNNAIWITEGEIKAHTIAFYLSVAAISIPGVGLWKQALECLKEVSAKEVVLAFDSDCTDKKEVARALLKLRQTLISGGYDVKIANW